MKLENVFKIILSFLTFIFGGLDSLLSTLIILMIIDYITGICKGIYKQELNSKFGIKGIIKKFGYLIIVVLATLFDKVVGDKAMAIRALMLYFFIANEAISILENWASMELPLPKKIFEVFEKLKENK